MPSELRVAGGSLSPSWSVLAVARAPSKRTAVSQTDFVLDCMAGFGKRTGICFVLTPGLQPRVLHSPLVSICHSKLPRMTQSSSEAGPTSREKEWKTISPRESRVVLKPQSWHNRTGEIVREFSEDIWLIERGYIFLKTIDVGGRTTLVKLPDGGLFVHSPLALTKVLKRCIDEIGPVRVVAAPNTEHVDFIAQWKHHYPEACFLGPPGSLEKLPHVPFTRELSRDNTLDESLADASISQFFIGTAPFFNETVFVHHPSKTLLCTDFYWAFPRGPDVPRPTRAFGWGMDYLFKPVYERILVKDQRQFVRNLHSILSTGFDKIIPCHGDIAETEGQKILSTFFSERLSP